MFQDYSGESCGFSPCPEKDKALSESSTQTSKRNTEDQATQTKISGNAQVQTELEVITEAKCDMNKLSAFLNRVYPKLVEELDKVDLMINDGETSDENLTTSQLHLIEPQEPKGKKVSNISWSCTGMTLAASFCEINHEGWCTHDGAVNLYNTSRPNFATSPPTQTLQTVSCITCISHHPWEPSVLAAGLYSGDVVVWDLRHDEEQVLSKKKENMETDRHLEAVTCIEWTHDMGGPLLVTAGQDGRILVWKISFSNQMLQLQHRFFISTEYSPFKHNLTNTGLEVTSISFWKEVENEFIISTDGGGVFHCSVRGSRPLSSQPSFNDPVVFKYQPHKGIVTCVNCSSASLFASCATDCEIHIYKQREAEIFHIINTDYPLAGLEWTDTLNVLACWGASTDVEFYKVTTEEKLQYHTVKTENGGQITTAKINQQRKGIMAIGSESGIISIWSLPINGR